MDAWTTVHYLPGGWPDISFRAPYTAAARAAAEAESRAKWARLNELAWSIGQSETEGEFVARAQALGLG